jgi:hypothetical protein
MLTNYIEITLIQPVCAQWAASCVDLVCVRLWPWQRSYWPTRSMSINVNFASIHSVRGHSPMQSASRSLNLPPCESTWLQVWKNLFFHSINTSQIIATRSFSLRMNERLLRFFNLIIIWTCICSYIIYHNYTIYYFCKTLYTVSTLQIRELLNRKICRKTIKCDT